MIIRGINLFNLMFTQESVKIALNLRKYSKEFSASYYIVLIIVYFKSSDFFFD